MNPKLRVLSELGRRTEAPPISWLMAAALARPQLISLAAGFTDNPTLPVAEARELLTGLLGSAAEGAAALQYGTTAGDPALRRLTGERLAHLDETAATATYAPEHLVMTSGSQQLLYMLTEVLCDAGDLVLVEDPTYFVYLGILQSHGVGARGVRIEADGLDLAHLEQVLEQLKRTGELPRLKLLYLVSYYQNPAGITTSYAKKCRALELLHRYERAAGHPIYLLEDAAYRELRFGGESVASALTAPRGTERVLYAGTYSKPFATGVRIGFGRLPQPILEAVLRVKGNHDFGTTNLLQQLLSRALAGGHYQRHLSRLRERYSHKAGVMRQAMKDHFPHAVQWWEPGGGLYFWARLPRALKSGPKSKLFKAALAHEVLYVPGELCYASDPTRPKPSHELNPK